MSTIDEIRQLEELLLRADVRSSKSRLEELLAPAFVEFGSSGNVWDRERIVTDLQDEKFARNELHDFHARELAPNVVLATYRVRRPGEEGEPDTTSLRSSVWVKAEGRWQMTFHQGTPARS